MILHVWNIDALITEMIIIKNTSVNNLLSLLDCMIRCFKLQSSYCTTQQFEVNCFIFYYFTLSFYMSSMFRYHEHAVVLLVSNPNDWNMKVEWMPTGEELSGLTIPILHGMRNLKRRRNKEWYTLKNLAKLNGQKVPSKYFQTVKWKRKLWPA